MVWVSASTAAAEAVHSVERYVVTDVDARLDNNVIAGYKPLHTHNVWFDSSAGPITQAIGIIQDGEYFTCSRHGANTVTLTPDASQTIEGESDSFIMNVDGAAATFVCRGTDLVMESYPAYYYYPDFQAPLSRKTDATTAPGVTNDINDTGASDGVGYVPGSLWVDVTGDDAYICVDNTDGAAVWKQITP